MVKSTIDVMKTAKSKIPLRECMKCGLLPRYPFSILISGRSGCGKTNLLMNLMKKKEYYGGWFHGILVFSPTAGEFDDTYNTLKLPKENFIKDFTPDILQKIIDRRKALIKQYGIKHVAENFRICLILDDVIADRNFLESPEALKMFALCRHYLISSIMLIQSYNKCPRACRLSCNGVFVFPALQSEKKVLIDELTPSNMTKKEFGKVFDHCTEGQYDFLYINNHAPPNERIRKNLETINLEDFKG